MGSFLVYNFFNLNTWFLPCVALHSQATYIPCGLFVLLVVLWFQVLCSLDFWPGRASRQQDQCFSECGLQTTHIRIPRELFTSTASWAPPQTSWEWLRDLSFLQATWWHSYALKVETQSFRTVGLDWGQLCPRNIWQCLKTFSVATTQKGVLLTSDRQRPGMLLTSYKAQDRAHHREWSDSKCQ